MEIKLEYLLDSGNILICLRFKNIRIKHLGNMDICILKYTA